MSLCPDHGFYSGTSCTLCLLYGKGPMLVQAGTQYSVHDVHGNRKEWFVPDPELTMKAPTEEQLKDPKWWDENAPEGAEFYGPEIKDWCQCWYAKRPAWSAYFGGRWNDFGHDDELLDAFFEQRLGGLYPRPTKPAKEWDGETFPVPIGQKCECTFAVEHHDTWHKGEVVFHGIDPEGREYMVIDTGAYQACFRSLDYIRPIRTQAEREREELADLCRAKFNQHTSSSNSYLWQQVADAIIAAGWRKGE